MYIDAKNFRCWKCSPEDSQNQFPPSPVFQHDRQVVSTALNLSLTYALDPKKAAFTIEKNNKNTKLRFPGEKLDSLFLM